MSSDGEVLTLQFGNYANYIGAHWWNIQESGFSYDGGAEGMVISHDVLYREGINHNRQTTYTPRLLLVDLDGSLKHLPREGELYGNSIKRSSDLQSPTEKDEAFKKLKEDLAWQSANVEVVVQPEVAKNEFQSDLDNSEMYIDEKDYRLADNVETWADFLYVRYHPRTVHVVKQYRHDAEKQAFDTYSGGTQLWKSDQFQDDFCDHIRQYVEECDYLQGFQTIFDSFNGFAGLATECLEHLNDEYSKASLAIPVYSPRHTYFENAGYVSLFLDEAMSDSIRIANSALTFHQLAVHSSLFIPLSTRDRVWRQLGSARQFRFLKYQTDNLYQTSAILAAYLDTLTLRYRLKNASSSNTLGGFCAELSNYGRKLSAAAFALPFPMQHDVDLIDCLDKFEGPLFTQLTPNCSIGTDYVIQSLCMRGIPPQRLKRPREQAPLQMRMAAYKCESVSEMLQLYLQCSHHASMSHVSSIASPMPTRIPFPCEIFDERVTTDGFFNPYSRRYAEQRVHTVPILAAAQSSRELADTVEVLHREAKRIKISKLHRFKLTGLEEDEYDEAVENLLSFKDNYEDNFEL